MIDIHSHILPSLDDGAEDLNMSLNMLKHAIQYNTTTIIATPHYYRNHFEINYELVKKEVEKLKVEACNSNLDIKIYPGQEVFADNYTLELYKEGIIKGLCNTDYMLLEFPMDKFSESYIDIIYELSLLGVKPIIAHPERFLYIMENIEIVNKFIEEGCLFQINTGSITGDFGKKVEKTAKVLIEGGLCDFLASDAHSTGIRCTGLEIGMDKLNSICNLSWEKVQQNAELLLNNSKISVNHSKISKRKRFFSF